MTDDIAIRVDKVSKAFRLPHEKNRSLKSAFINVFRGKRTYERQTVLNDVSFDIKKGEFIGIVGRNGSGKSTMLKMLAGIYEPDKGGIHINGKLTPFIELGVGFNPELTGRENVYLNGALLGFNRKEMDAMYDEIVDFAELGRFMDQKLKNYSSGMQVRLAFSIAIRANTDILLLDEVLAVGDENFQRKCYEYFAKIKKQKQTVVFVSHDMDAVKDFCDRAILISEGKVVAEGSAKAITSKYSALNLQRLETELEQDSEGRSESIQRWGNGEARIESVWSSLNGKKRSAFKPKDKIEINMAIKAVKHITRPVIGMILQDAQGRTVFATNTKELDINLDDIPAGKEVTARFVIENIYTNGTYTVSGAIADFDRTTVFSRVEDAHRIAVSGWSMEHSIAHPEHSFKLS